MAQAVKQVFIQAFVSHTPVEAFHEAILHWLARCDVVPVNFTVLLPLQDRIRRQLGSVVADHRAGVATYLGDPVEFTGHADARQGRINDSGQTFTADAFALKGMQNMPERVIDHVQDTEPAATREAVRHEVERPPLAAP